MTLFRHLVAQVNTQTAVLRRLNFLLQEEANITDSFLLWVVEYCAKHDIPIGKEKRFQNLLTDSKRIMEEIKITSTTLEEICKKLASDGFFEK